MTEKHIHLPTIRPCKPTGRKHSLVALSLNLKPKDQLLLPIKPSCPLISNTKPYSAPTSRINSSRKFSFPKLEIKSVRTASFETTPSLFTKPVTPKRTLLETNLLIEQKVAPLLEQLSKLQNCLENYLSYEEMIEKLKESLGEVDQVIELAQKIFAIYNMKLEIITRSNRDSIMEVEGMKADKSKLAILLKVLVPLLCKIPYSFLKKLGIVSFKVCHDVHLFKSVHDDMVIAKLYSGILPLNKLQTEEQIGNFFFGVIIYHLKRNVSNFDKKWSDLILPEEGNSEAAQSSSRTQRLKRRTQHTLNHQAKILKQFFLHQNGCIDSKISVAGLQELLEEVDPDAMFQNFVLKTEESTWYECTFGR